MSFGDGGGFVLGAIDDPMDYDFVIVDDAGASDPRAAYLAWAAAVKQHGGTVTAAPHVVGSPLSARYPAAFVFPHAPDPALNPLFHRQPDDWSNDGRSVYYIAPDAALAYAANGMLTPQSVPGETPPPNPKWYNELIAALKTGGLIVGGIASLVALSYLPRGRR